MNQKMPVGSCISASAIANLCKQYLGFIPANLSSADNWIVAEYGNIMVDEKVTATKLSNQNEAHYTCILLGENEEFVISSPEYELEIQGVDQFRICVHLPDSAVKLIYQRRDNGITTMTIFDAATLEVIEKRDIKTHGAFSPVGSLTIEFLTHLALQHQIAWILKFIDQLQTEVENSIMVDRLEKVKKK